MYPVIHFFYTSTFTKLFRSRVPINARKERVGIYGKGYRPVGFSSLRPIPMKEKSSGITYLVWWESFHFKPKFIGLKKPSGNLHLKFLTAYYSKKINTLAT
jgi:hypothetical protein